MKLQETAESVGVNKTNAGEQEVFERWIRAVNERWEIFYAKNVYNEYHKQLGEDRTTLEIFACGLEYGVELERIMKMLDVAVEKKLVAKSISGWMYSFVYWCVKGGKNISFVRERVESKRR